MLLADTAQLRTVPGVPSASLTIADLQALCGATIRAQLSWAALQAAPVSAAVLTGQEALGALRTVWYADNDGRPGGYSNPAHRQLTVAQAAAIVWSEDREAVIAAHADHMRRGRLEQEPVVLTTPAYALRDGRLILDGTHRAIAARRVGADVRVLLLTVHGPLNAAVLPDLTRS